MVLSPVFRLYLFIFLYAGLFMGLSTLASDLWILPLWEMSPGPTSTPVLHAVFMGSFFGVCMAATGGTTHISRVRRVLEHWGDMRPAGDVLSAHQRCDVTLPQPKEQLAALCNEAVQKTFVDAKVEGPVRDSWVIRTRGSSYSCGEIVEVSIEPAGDEETRLTIHSRPKWFLNHLDCGKNLENVKRVAQSVASLTESV